MTTKPSSVQKRLEGLSAGQAQLFDLLLRKRTARTGSIEPCPRPSEGEALMPASWAQQRLWFVEQLEGPGAAYNISLTLRIEGPLSGQALRAALDALVRRHETLRTVFVSIDGEPRQKICGASPFSLSIVDLEACEEQQRAAELREHMAREASAPFDLQTGPLIRGRWLRLSECKHVLLLTMHHIVSDGWSMGVLLEELGQLYGAHLDGRAEPLPPLTVQYADYAQWQRLHLGGPALDSEVMYWRQRLKDIPAELTLPSDRARPAVQSYRGASIQVAFDEELSRSLKSFAQRHQLTLFMTLYAAWAILLSRLSSQDDVVVGTPLANRAWPEVEPLIGFFVNSSVLRVNADGAMRLADFLRQVKEVTVAAFEHQNMPFEKIVEAVQPQRTLSRHPIFQVMFAFQSTRAVEPRLADLIVTQEDAAVETVKFDLLLSLGEHSGRIVGSADYATDLFERATVERWLTCYETLLRAMLVAQDESIGDLPLLSDVERRQVVAQFNTTQAPFPDDVTVAELFERQAAKTPHEIALVHERSSLSYRDLNGRANQLAHYLRAHGVVPDQPVGLCVERSIDMVVGLLGILKAGGAYLPLDPQYPIERLRYVLADSAPKVVLTQAPLLAALPPTDATVIALDRDWSRISSCTADNVDASAAGLHSSHLAYVIYTSGSTGAPKGVMVEHRNLASLWQGLEQLYQQAPESRRVAVNASFNFDASVKQFVQLLSGRTIVLVPRDARWDAAALLNFIEQQQVDCVDCTPGQLKAWLAAGLLLGRAPGLKMVLVGGEPIDAELWTLLSQSAVTQFFNVYGPTESTVDSTFARIGGDVGPPHIGSPMQNRQLYILDRQARPLPIGVPGELYIGGAGVARGYLHRPELNAERFVRDPFSSNPAARLYRSGDLARWRADGVIEYVGRNDCQVKIRGFRIELGEIEAQLLQQPYVKEAVAVARQDIPGEQRLVAYVVLDAESAGHPTDHARALHDTLKAALPEYMVPSAFVALDCLPLTPNGKLDRHALPAPEHSARVSRRYEPPQGDVENAVAGIWQVLLQLEQVGRNDNFFELGGHSLLIMQLLDRLRRLGLHASVRRVFESTTLAELAAGLSRGQSSTADVSATLIPPGCTSIAPEMLRLVCLEPEHIDRIVNDVPGGAANIEDIYPLAPLQEGVLFHHLLTRAGGDVYVVPILLQVNSRHRLDQMIAALQAAIDRHQVLRTAVLWEQMPQPVQIVYRQASLTVEEIQLSSDGVISEQLQAWLQPRLQHIDIRRAPLFRLRVARHPCGEHWFALLQMHHITSDHVSLEIITAEIVAQLNGQQMPAAASAIPYRNHVARVIEFARTHDIEGFFRARLGDVDEPTAPFGLTDVHGDGADIAEHVEDLPTILARRIRLQASRCGVSAATLFHAGWALVVAQTSGRDDVVFGSVLLGRFEEHQQRQLGMFINTLPLRVRLAGVSARQVVDQVQRELVELLGYDQASLALAQRCSQIAGPARLFSALLNYRHSSPNPHADWGAAQGVQLLAAQERTNYPLAMSVDDLGEGFSLKAQTDLRIDPRRLVSYLRTAMSSLIEALERAPQMSCLDLGILPRDEERQVVEQFNATRATPPPETRMCALFEAQVERAPQAVAVAYEGRLISYAELNSAANQLAHHLRAQGMQAGECVPVMMPRSLQMLIAQLAILKNGGAYLPLDPLLPAERCGFIVRDCGARRALCDSELPPAAAPDLQWIDCKAVAAHVAGLPEENPPAVASTVAYVMYTSGSTGIPKGVVVEQRGVINLVVGNELAAIAPEDCLVHHSNPSFDASTLEVWGALLNGARTVVAPQNVVLDAAKFAELLSEQGATILYMSVGLFTQYSDALAKVFGRLRCLMVGGDKLDSAAVRRVLRNSPPQRLLNVYGPTECTTIATKFLIEQLAEDAADVPIGSAISNVQVYVLDHRQRPAPIEVIGEICIGGPGVAREYLNRPELTAERFVPDPFSAAPGARLYRTGDLGRWRADGTIAFLGRNDHQVKIRGFRIELGEIESRLMRHPAVKEALVLAREDLPGTKRLVAYVVARGGTSAPGAEELRTHLKAALPDYMVPGAFVVLERMPLTPNGKVDRRALPAPELGAYVSREYEAPQGEVEEIVAGIWQALLGVERVGRRDNFFELGGHSLLIVQMMERLRRVGLTADLRCVFDSATLAELAGRLGSGATEQFAVPPNLIPAGCEALTPQMLPLVELEAEHIERIVRAVPGGAANIQDIYPLAPLQEGILFHHLLNEHSPDMYVLPTVLAVSSRERLDQLLAALQTAVERHDILRTAMLWEHLPRPVQVVLRRATVGVDQITLAADRDTTEQINEWVRPERLRMDLRRAPTMRLWIAADPHAEGWYVLLHLHHIVVDATSLRAIIAEVVLQLEGRVEELAAPVPYRSHVAQALVYARTHDAEAFFRGKLGDVDEPTAPFGLLDVHGDGAGVEESTIEVEAQLARQIRVQARRHAVSAATLFHAAWALVVARTSGRDDVVFGSVLLGRLQSSVGAQQVLGLFINTLPLRVQLQGVSAKALVERTQRELVELLAHEQASLAVAQRCSGISGSAPLFSTLLNYRHSDRLQADSWNDAPGVTVIGGHSGTNYPITFSVDDLGEGFALTAQTDRRIDARRMTGYMRTALQSLIEALESAPLRTALELAVMPMEERREVVEVFNATAMPYEREKLVHELFEEQVQRTGQAVAVMYEGESLSYRELNARANQLARYLREQGVQSDQPVGICMERSIEMVVGVLGILKAGAAYVPLDPNYPAERLQYMAQDAAPQVVLTQQRLRAGLPATQARVVELDGEPQCLAGLMEENLGVAQLGLHASNLVYVIYTSGSTGRPKGTGMPHGAMVNLIQWHRRTFGTGEGVRVLQFAALSFDVAFQEIFTTLCTGGTLVLLDEWLRKDARKLLQLLSDRGIQRLFVPPLMLQSLAESYKTTDVGKLQLRDVITAGEQLRISAQIVQLFEQLAHCRLHNHYGPTETHVVTALTLQGEPQGWPALPSIGAPIANTQIHILDERGQPVPLGVAAEIYIAGANVARGYLHRAELTAQRFVRDPFSEDAQARMYRTGDLGRWLADGSIEYLGRNDDQVKIRGYRIELGEIEAQLAQHQQVREAAVVVREDVPGEKRLVGYITAQPDGAPGPEQLRAHLKASLPEHMVPSAFVLLQSLPLTPSGKLNRRALPAPELDAYRSAEYQAPRGEVEEILAGIWQSLLRIERVGRNDNFFELGGHSLHSMRLIAQLEALCRVRLSVIGVFRHPTIHSLAEHIESMRWVHAEHQFMTTGDASEFEEGVLDEDDLVYRARPPDGRAAGAAER